MRIQVKLFASLQQGRFEHHLVDLAAPFTLGCLLDHLAISETDTGLLLRNGLQTALHDPLREGDLVAIFPLIGGG